VTLTFDLSTLEVVSESRVLAISVPFLVNPRPLYSRVTPNVRDRHTPDRRQTDEASLNAPAY